jgi:diphosphomevalonate decarboxylase
MRRAASAGEAGAVREASAIACSNVALVKYWGKRDVGLNLPAVGSVSLTLGELQATARVHSGAGGARFLQDGAPVGGVAEQRMVAFLDHVAELAHQPPALRVEVEANFPVGAGLASSAAIFCATAAAAASVVGLRTKREELSALARLGSGSAARSVFGGFVEWRRGVRSDGADSIAVQIQDESVWNLAMAVAVTSEEKKAVASRDAMEHVVATSPLFGGWVEAQAADLVAMRDAIATRDLARVGTIAEENCLRMHATAIAARPPVIYWTPATMAAICAVREMRGDGLEAYFTIDAGPQVKALCRAADLPRVAERLASVPGVRRVLQARPGPGVRMVEGGAPWA